MFTSAFVVTMIVGWLMPVQTPPRPATPAQDKRPVAPGSYVGTQACRQCHKDKVDSFLKTAHHRTSALPTRESILGKFTPDANVLTTSNPRLFFKMETVDGGFSQSAVVGTPPDTTSRSERFGLVTGSGKKGQTYLFWKGDQLFQLPISYWTESRQWINSPGYADGTANFDRAVVPRCLECHATYFESLSSALDRTRGVDNHYQTSGFIVGIACEKCHGPGTDHVARPRASRTAPAGPIVNPARQPRDRQMDTCAVCHAGPVLSARAPAFSYVPGQPLEEYFDVRRSGAGRLDVHGSQTEMLRASRCFMSSAMTCTTCHNVHVVQRDTAALSARCATCHKVDSCPTFKQAGRQIAGKCVDCHMPNMPTAQIVLAANGTRVQPLVRAHWIKVYPEESRRVLNGLAGSRGRQ